MIPYLEEEAPVEVGHLYKEDQKPLGEEQEDHQMETQEVMDPQMVEDIHPDEVHLEEEDPQDHQEEDHLVPLETLDPQETKESQELLLEWKAL